IAYLPPKSCGPCWAVRLLVGRFRLPPDPISYKIASTTGGKPGNCNGRMNMSLNQVLYSTAAAIGIAALATSVAPVSAQPKPPQGVATPAVAIDADDIGGVVRGAKGPEAGVWVIAETTDLPTRYTKSVVTDDQGRYVIPDLPTANYQVWVHGYGLVDSPKLRAKPGQNLDLTAVTAPSPAAAAHYYPAIYWYT